jgi:hypothetical protein
MIRFIDITDNKKLSEKGFKTGYPLYELNKVFTETYNTDFNVSPEEFFEIINKFSKGNMKDLMFFTDSLGLLDEFKAKNDKSIKIPKLIAVVFDNIIEAIDLFKKVMIFGADNLCVTNKSFDYVITLCHDEDVHVSGTKEFVEKFKKDYLTKVN